MTAILPPTIPPTPNPIPTWAQTIDEQWQAQQLQQRPMLEITAQEYLPDGRIHVGFAATPKETPPLDKNRTWLVIEKVLTDWIPGIAGSRLIEKIKEDVMGGMRG